MTSMMRYYPLIDILRAALFGQPAKLQRNGNLVAVLAEAEKQAVTPMAFQRLAETDVKLPSEVVFRQMGIQQQVAQRNAVLNEQVVSLAQFYRGNMGHYNKRGGFHGWKHKLESTAIKLSHFVKFYPLAPSFMRDWGWSVIKSRL